MAPKVANDGGDFKKRQFSAEKFNFNVIKSKLMMTKSNLDKRLKISAPSPIVVALLPRYIAPTTKKHRKKLKTKGNTLANVLLDSGASCSLISDKFLIHNDSRID